MVGAAFCVVLLPWTLQDAVSAIIGFWGGIAGQITGVVLSISSDFLGGRKRAMLIGLSGLSVVLIGKFGQHKSPDLGALNTTDVHSTKYAA